MKSNITLFLFTLWTVAVVNAQTCPGAPLTLSTQAQVNNFPTNYPGCTEVGVSITISGSNITNLNGLTQLQSITKSLFIINCSSLTSLAGLSNLSNIGVELTIDNCDALTTLNGLQSLPFIGGTLTLTGNALLNNLTALNGVDHVNGSIDITQNPALTSLAGLDNVEFCGRYLQITNNNGLTSLNSLTAITEVGNNVNTNGRYLSIGSNPNLTTLNGLNNLVSVGTDFDIANNAKLASLNAFADLATIGGHFSITGNALLTSILDFASISSIGNGLTISNNNILTDCEAQGICDYLDGPGPAAISNNDPGCNSVAQVEAECLLLLPVELAFIYARRNDDGILLEWQTASEKDNAYFQVEHSMNGKTFQAIGELPGKGTTATANQYHFLHDKPSVGTNYYRLKQVDYDGKFEYSKIVSAVIHQEETIHIFPNPTDGPVFVKGQTDESTARVTDLTGKVIWENALPENGMIDLGGQPNGIYFVEVITGGRRSVIKIWKE
ncbi:MAG TPA: T9SS type A sorting domain-containing protein [Saprospiraceae bacterium]|nr:T9SS type A sorting domain-containing protein [Saprospiraceae bacterium]